MKVTLERLDVSRREDFCAVMRDGSGESAACFCTAYYARDGQPAGEACRERFFTEGRSDGYLLYVDGRVAGWCRCGPWDSFDVLAGKPQDAWAITCMVLAPHAKGRGLSHVLLRDVLADLRTRGVRRVVAFAHRLGPTYSSPLAELPESVCIKAGMTLERDDPECPRYGLTLAP